jgi:hypothetical protein
MQRKTLRRKKTGARTLRVLYKSKAGPFGFHPQDLAAALQKTNP